MLKATELQSCDAVRPSA